MSQRKRLFQKLNDLCLALQIVRSVVLLPTLRHRIAGKRRPKKMIGDGHVLHLPGKRAHALVLAPWNLQTLRRKVEFVFRHRFGGRHNFFFDATDLAVHHRADGWRRLRRQLRRRRWRAGRRRALHPRSESNRGKPEYRQHHYKDSHSFHRSLSPRFAFTQTIGIFSRPLPRALRLKTPSYLSATSGSTRTARRAAISHASHAPAISSSATLTNVTGSVG